MTAHADLGSVFGPWRYYAPYYYSQRVTHEWNCFPPHLFLPRYQDPNPVPDVPPPPQPDARYGAPPVMGMPMGGPPQGPPPVPASAPGMIMPCPSRQPTCYPQVIPQMSAPCPMPPAPMCGPYPSSCPQMRGPMPVPYGPIIHPEPISPRVSNARAREREWQRKSEPRDVTRRPGKRSQPVDQQAPPSASGSDMPQSVPGTPYPVYRSAPGGDTGGRSGSMPLRPHRRIVPSRGASADAGQGLTYTPRNVEFSPPPLMRRAVFREFDE